MLWQNSQIGQGTVILAISSTDVNVARVKKYHTVTADDVPTEWEVSKVLAARETGGEREYLVRWEGFTERANSWMTEEMLDSPQLVNEYFRAGLGNPEEELEGMERVFWNEPEEDEV